MQLLAVGLWGYRRFESDEGNLDVAGNPIAIVGPNEVGKTSFLRALEHLNSEGEFDVSELTRRGDGKAGVRAVFALDEGDYEAIRDVGGIGEPVVYTVWKEADGRLYAKLEPELRRDRSPRERVISLLTRVRASRWWQDLGADNELGLAIAETHDLLIEEGENIDASVLERMSATADAIDDDDAAPATAKALSGRLKEVVKDEATDHPKSVALQILFRRRPLFLWFPDDRRQIPSTHVVGTEELSPALENLLALIDFDLDALRVAAVERPDRATTTEIINEAREAFREIFEGRWRQARVRVELAIDANVLSIFVTNTAGRLVPIAERSEGLRQFIALLAFVEKEAANRDAIVLIDEAEQHLHYDAQADLVRVFSGQTAAKKIIYTTHSAGCLPHDIGTGVRVLEPCGPDDVPPEEWDRSRVQNWFYTKGPGFSPLLIAMGASTFAFAGARKAIVAEGISDALLLPTLFREATGLDALDLQVAPGLANISKQTLDELDFVASRVVYLLDGDEAGREKQQMLVDLGIPEDRVRVLPNDLTLEDLIRKTVYVSAVNKELELRQRPMIAAADVPDVGRKRALETWAAANLPRGAEDAPSERAVAHHILDAIREARLRGETLGILEPSRKRRGGSPESRRPPS
jgi:hypothetical protein